MAETNDTLESGALLPVLSRATHQELNDIVLALNKSWDVFISWDSRYPKIRNDLTQDPGFVAEYIYRTGGYSFADWPRSSARSYSEIVSEVCRGIGIKTSLHNLSIVEVETLLLRTILDKVLKKMSASDRESLEQRMREIAGADWSLKDVLNGGATLAAFLPALFAATAEILLAQGIVGVGAFVVGRAALGLLGPIGLMLGFAWLALNFAGPSLRGLVPAVTCVALLRQRMMWNNVQ